MKIYKAFNRLSSGAGRAWRRADETAGCVPSIELSPGQTGLGVLWKLLETQTTYSNEGCAARHTVTRSAAHSMVTEGLLCARHVQNAGGTCENSDSSQRGGKRPQALRHTDLSSFGGPACGSVPKGASVPLAIQWGNVYSTRLPGRGGRFIKIVMLGAWLFSLLPTGFYTPSLTSLEQSRMF